MAMCTAAAVAAEKPSKGAVPSRRTHQRATLGGSDRERERAANRHQR
jgi:hypothetical protein